MINSAIIIGRLTKDPEIRKTKSGLSVVQFTVAVNRPKAPDGTQQADFIQCQAWRASADYLGTYGRKGYLVGVSGRIQTRNYDDKDGRKVYVTEVICRDVNILEHRQQEQSTGYQQPAPSQSYASQTSYEPDDLPPISSEDLPF